MLTVLRYETEAWYPILVWEPDFLQAVSLMKVSDAADSHRGLLPLLPKLTRRAEYPIASSRLLA